MSKIKFFVQLLTSPFSMLYSLLMSMISKKKEELLKEEISDLKNLLEKKDLELYLKDKTIEELSNDRLYLEKIIDNAVQTQRDEILSDESIQFLAPLQRILNGLGEIRENDRFEFLKEIEKVICIIFEAEICHLSISRKNDPFNTALLNYLERTKNNELDIFENESWRKLGPTFNDTTPTIYSSGNFKSCVLRSKAEDGSGLYKPFALLVVGGTKAQVIDNRLRAIALLIEPALYSVYSQQRLELITNRLDAIRDKYTCASLGDNASLLNQYFNEQKQLVESFTSFDLVSFYSELGNQRVTIPSNAEDDVIYRNCEIYKEALALESLYGPESHLGKIYLQARGRDVIEEDSVFRRIYFEVFNKLNNKKTNEYIYFPLMLHGQTSVFLLGLVSVKLQNPTWFVRINDKVFMYTMLRNIDDVILQLHAGIVDKNELKRETLERLKNTDLAKLNTAINEVFIRASDLGYSNLNTIIKDAIRWHITEAIKTIQENTKNSFKVFTLFLNGVLELELRLDQSHQFEVDFLDSFRMLISECRNNKNSRNQLRDLFSEYVETIPSEIKPPVLEIILAALSKIPHIEEGSSEYYSEAIVFSTLAPALLKLATKETLRTHITFFKSLVPYFLKSNIKDEFLLLVKHVEELEITKTLQLEIDHYCKSLEEKNISQLQSAVEIFSKNMFEKHAIVVDKEAILDDFSSEKREAEIYTLLNKLKDRFQTLERKKLEGGDPGIQQIRLSKSSRAYVISPTDSPTFMTKMKKSNKPVEDLKNVRILGKIVINHLEGDQEYKSVSKRLVERIEKVLNSKAE